MAGHGLWWIYRIGQEVDAEGSSGEGTGEDSGDVWFSSSL